MTEERRSPRYTGVRTFAGLPEASLAQSAQASDHPDLAIVGIPFDTATSWRAGARFAPEAIRSASVMLRPWHPIHRIDVFSAQAVVDGGDIAITPGNAHRSMDQIATALTPLYRAGVTPLALGGDHLVTLGELRACASVHGPVGLVLLDAHVDTWNDYYGEQLFHGTVLRRALEEGLLDPGRSLIAGMRGSLYSAANLIEARELGFELIGIDELAEEEPSAFGARARERLSEGPAFLGLDIDVIDPSAAPGTGTPEVGGLGSARALALLRALADIRFVGFDLVEVSPPYDAAGQITALLAANLAYEMLALAAVVRA